jgi:predicted glycosyl hydrolase (DUF1957 family)
MAKASTFGTGLFGHWRYEGVWFLETVFDGADIRNSRSNSNSGDHSILTTPASFIDSNPVQTHAQRLKSS